LLLLEADLIQEESLYQKECLRLEVKKEALSCPLQIFNIITEMIRTKRFKYVMGWGVIIGCWLMSIIVLRGHYSMAEETPQEKGEAPSLCRPSLSVDLPLPQKATEAELLGIDLQLFDPEQRRLSRKNAPRSPVKPCRHRSKPNQKKSGR